MQLTERNDVYHFQCSRGVEVEGDVFSEVLLEISEKPSVTDCRKFGGRRGKVPIRPIKFSVRRSGVSLMND